MKRIILAILIAIFILPYQAWGATKTVCASGCDYTTLTTAEAGASAGDTVNVSTGTYDEVPTFTKGIAWVAVDGNGTVTVIKSAGAAQGTIIAAGAGVMSFTGFHFSGGDTITTSVVHLQNGANNKTFTDCTFSCGAGAAQLINFSAAATGIAITRPTFTGTPSVSAITATSAGASTVTVTDMTVSSFTSARVVYVSADTAGWTVTGGTITASLTSKAFAFDAHGAVSVSGVTATLTNTPDGFFHVATAAKTGAVTFTNNTITYSGTVSDTPIINVTDGDHITVITGNSITANAAGQAQPGIYVAAQNTAVNVSNNTVTFNGTTSNTVIPIRIAGAAGEATTLTLSGNTVLSTQTGAQAILVGTDLTGTGDNVIDGATISGNSITLVSNAAVHGIEYGYNKNGTIKGNYVYGGRYGIVIKGNETYASGGVFYNILKDQSYEGIRVKGVKNLLVYNNTFYLSSGRSISNGLLYVTVNADSANATSTGTVVKNNIFVADGGNNLINCDANSSTGLTPDYNLYYMASGIAPIYSLTGAVGTANAAVSSNDTTMTDTRLAMTTDAWVGAVITSNGKTMTVTANTETVFTGAAWSGGGNPGNGQAWSLVYQLQGVTAWTRWQGVGYDANSPTPSNPLFVSATDFRLGGGSPAINAGVVVSGVHPGTDYLGNPNNVNGAPDIGAYEWFPTGLHGVAATGATMQ